MRYGLTIPLEGLALHEQPRAWAELAALGYTDFWTAEGGRFDGLTPLAAAALAAPQARLGAGVISAFTRGPGLIAQTAAALGALAPGRFVLGIGASSPAIVQRWNAGCYERPYQRTADLLRFLRRALAGERVSESYATFAIKGFGLPQPPPLPVPLVVAAMGPRMLQLGAAEADGVIINWVGPEDARKMAGIARSARPDTEVIDRITVIPSEDSEKVRAFMKPNAAVYLSVPGYRAAYQKLGWGARLAAMWAAADAGDRRAAAAAVPDELVDAVCTHGPVEACRARIRQYLDAGVDTPVLNIPAMPGLDVLGAARALAPASG